MVGRIDYPGIGANFQGNRDVHCLDLVMATWEYAPERTHLIIQVEYLQFIECIIPQEVYLYENKETYNLKGNRDYS